MTSLRFVGDLPLLIGLLLALLLGGLSWRYYSRESFGLPRPLRLLLPLLRASAFFLGVMILTGPVLHHRRVVGKLGKVRIYLDGSASMNLHDRHMPTARKLMIAEQLGWLNAGSVDVSLLKLADQLKEHRQALLLALGSTSADSEENTASSTEQNEEAAPAAATTNEPVTAFLKQVTVLAESVPETLQESFQRNVVDAAGALSQRSEPVAVDDPQLQALVSASDLAEVGLRNAFDVSVSAARTSSHDSLEAALTLFDETPRWRRTEMALNESSAKVLAELKTKHDVQVFVLNGDASQSVQIAEASEATSPAIFAPDQLSTITDLSSGIADNQKVVGTSTEGSEQDSAISGGSSSAAAIVLVSDGQHNAGGSPLQMARVLAAQGLTFCTVATGAAAQAADLAVIRLEHPEVVFQRDTVRGAMILRDQVEAGRPFVAQIRYGDNVLWQQQLVTQHVAERRIDFEFSIEELVAELGAGFTDDVVQHALPLALEASVSPLAEEVETSNNQQTLRLAAITESYRVLILDGRPRWETRYLRNVFERDDQWSVDTVIAGPGTDAAALPRGDRDNQFPANRDALFDYDLIIFGEIDRQLFADHEWEWLRDFVAVRGGGMVFVDGARQKLSQLVSTQMASLVPVEWNSTPVSSKVTSLKLSDLGASIESLKLATDEQQNRRFWTELPPPHSVVSVTALPGAQVLVEADVNGQQFPAIVTRNVGAGRVLFLAFDETWRWRYKAADLWHQRVWNQMARYVMPRPFAVSDEYVSIDSGAVCYQSGDRVDLRIRLLGLDGKPSVSATVDALLWKDGRVVATIGLSADPDVPGIFRGRTGPLPQGGYEVSVRAAGYNDSVLKARSEFEVLAEESGEMIQTAANETLLNQMAQVSGGSFLREEEIGRLPELLAPLSSGRVVESDTLIWQSYWWFAAMVLLLTAEWILIKRAGML